MQFWRDMHISTKVTIGCFIFVVIIFFAGRNPDQYKSKESALDQAHLGGDHLIDAIQELHNKQNGGMPGSSGIGAIGNASRDAVPNYVMENGQMGVAPTPQAEPSLSTVPDLRPDTPAGDENAISGSAYSTTPRYFGATNPVPQQLPPPGQPLTPPPPAPAIVAPPAADGYYPPPATGANTGPRSMNDNSPLLSGQQIAFNGIEVYTYNDSGEAIPMPDGTYKTKAGIDIIVQGGKRVLPSNN